MRGWVTGNTSTASRGNVTGASSASANSANSPPAPEPRTPFPAQMTGFRAERRSAATSSTNPASGAMLFRACFSYLQISVGGSSRTSNGISTCTGPGRPLLAVEKASPRILGMSSTSRTCSDHLVTSRKTVCRSPGSSRPWKIPFFACRGTVPEMWTTGEAAL